MYEHSNVYLAKNERRNEVRVPNRQRLHSLCNITILRMIFHGCPTHFTDSTPDLLGRAGPWLCHCYTEAKERSLKDGGDDAPNLETPCLQLCSSPVSSAIYKQSNALGLPTFLGTAWLGNWEGI